MSDRLIEFLFHKVDRQGRFLADVTQYVASGSAKMDQDLDVKLQGRFVLKEAGVIDYLSEYLVPIVRITEDGVTTEYELGVFRLGRPKTAHTAIVSTGDVAAYDLGVHLLEDLFAEPYTVVAGSNAVNAAKAIAQGVGYLDGEGTFVPIFQYINFPVVTACLQSDMSWGVGESKYRAIADLLDAAGCWSPWAEGHGWLTSAVRQSLAEITPAVVYRTDPTSIVLPEGVQVETDATRFANKVIVRVQNPDLRRENLLTNPEFEDPLTDIWGPGASGTVAQESIDGSVVTTDDTHLTDPRRSWVTNGLVGSTATCNGKSMVVTANTATVATGAAGWSGGGNPGNGFPYTLSNYEETVYAGFGAAKWTAGAQNGGVWHLPDINVVPGRAYKFTFRLKGTSGDTFEARWEDSIGWTSMAAAAAIDSDRYVLRELEFTPDEAVVKTVEIRNTTATPHDFYVDSCMLGERDEPVPIYASYTNSNPDSPTSTASLGRTICKTIDAKNIQTQAAADAYARLMCEEAASVYKKATLPTALDPGRKIHEVYQLDIYRDGEELLTGNWWCNSWEMSLVVGGVMTHQLARVEAV